jgi:hypothetical protein
MTSVKATRGPALARTTPILLMIQDNGRDPSVSRSSSAVTALDWRCSSTSGAPWVTARDNPDVMLESLPAGGN